MSFFSGTVISGFRGNLPQGVGATRGAHMSVAPLSSHTKTPDLDNPKFQIGCVSANMSPRGDLLYGSPRAIHRFAVDVPNFSTDRRNKRVHVLRCLQIVARNRTTKRRVGGLFTMVVVSRMLLRRMRARCLRAITRPRCRRIMVIIVVMGCGSRGGWYVCC